MTAQPNYPSVSAITSKWAQRVGTPAYSRIRHYAEWGFAVAQRGKRGDFRYETLWIMREAIRIEAQRDELAGHEVAQERVAMHRLDEMIGFRVPQNREELTRSLVVKPKPLVGDMGSAIRGKGG